MLEEFVDLKEGDVIVQNGANSAVGQVRPLTSFASDICVLTNLTMVVFRLWTKGLLQLVIQLAKAKGIHTVNVVRDRPNMSELEHHLRGLGADVVTTDEKLKAALGEPCDSHLRHHSPQLNGCLL